MIRSMIYALAASFCQRRYTRTLTLSHDSRSGTAVRRWVAATRWQARREYFRRALQANRNQGAF